MADVIGGRFEIGEALGQGGMGTVYQGLDQQTRQPVAIKVLKPELVTANRDMVERFAREAEALRRLNHPNIVKMLALLTENERYFLVMEYVAGGSLADLLARERQLPLGAVLDIALELADALTRAHHLKIIHRDIKPANVLLADDGTPRLTDFGIARLDDQSRLTESGLVVGTFAYLSPEACEGRELDARTDIWSFGVMLYEMLTGRKPFESETAAATITSILMHVPPDLRALRPDAPPELAFLIGRMLQKDRDKRVSSVRQVGAELEAILHGDISSSVGAIRDQSPQPSQGESRFATPTPPLEDSPTTIAPTPQSSIGEGLRPSPTRSRFIWIAGIIVILVIGLVALVASGVLNGGSAATPTPPVLQSAGAGDYIVLVAPFTAVRTEAYDAAGLIAQDLKQHFEVEAPYSKLRIRQYLTTITSDDEAKTAAESVGATVVIWGNYTADTINANVQIGSLAAFKYNRFDRATLEKTANVQTQMTDETKESLAPQVSAVMGVLFNADGDLYGIARNWVTLEALKTVTAAPFVGESVAVRTHRYFMNYNDNPTQSVEEITAAINRDAGNALLYAFRSQAVYRTAKLKGDVFDPSEPSDELKRMRIDGASAQQFGPPDWPLIPTLDFSSAVLTYQSTTLSQHMIELRPDDWYLYFLQASVLTYYNEAPKTAWETARQALDRSIALHPDYAFPQAFAAYVALWQGRVAAAAALADDVRADILPDTFFAERLLLAEWALTTGGTVNRPGLVYTPFSKLIVGQYQEARDIIVQQATSGRGGDQFLLGLAQCDLGDTERAKLAFSFVKPSTSVGFIVNLFNALVDLKLGQKEAALSQIGVVQRSDQGDLLAPFTAAVLNRDFDCADLFNSQKIAEIMQKYGSVKAADISATLTAVPTATTTP